MNSGNEATKTFTSATQMCRSLYPFSPIPLYSCTYGFLPLLFFFLFQLGMRYCALFRICCIMKINPPPTSYPPHSIFSKASLSSPQHPFCLLYSHFSIAFVPFCSLFYSSFSQAKTTAFISSFLLLQGGVCLWLLTCIFIAHLVFLRTADHSLTLHHQYWSVFVLDVLDLLHFLLPILFHFSPFVLFLVFFSFPLFFSSLLFSFLLFLANTSFDWRNT